jgi:AraC family transcriptional regulator
VHADHFGDLSVRCFIIEVETQWLTRFHECSIRLDEPVSFHGSSLAWLVMRLRNESKLRDDFTSLTVEGLMLEIMAEIARKSIRIPGRGDPRWLNQAKEILHENFTHRLTLSDIAEAVRVHPVYLAGMFRQHYHCSIGEYTRRLRIEFASRELSQTARPLAHIALAAGFADQAHFSRTFKRLTGLTPAQYRSITRSS